jgi:glycerate 2-kinase
MIKNMISAEQFLTHTLSSLPQGASVARILAAAISAVEPGAAVQRFVQREGNLLQIKDCSYDLDEINNIKLLAFGKAAYGMLSPLSELLADHTPRTLLIPKHAPLSTPAGMDVFPGGHPVPNEASLLAGQKILDFVSDMDERDLLICLISGGGSALVTAPLPGLTLADIQALTSVLLECGARIDEINTLRRHLDRIKGGGVAKLASPARVVSLILSDVVNNPLADIASGPTAPDPSTLVDAINVIKHYHLRDKIPPAVIDILQNAPETSKPDDPLFVRVQNVVVGSNIQAAQAALLQAEVEGFHPYLLRTDLQGEAREAARELCAVLRWAWQRGEPVTRPFCIVAGGETTVTQHGTGRGGRNQELALAAVVELADFPDAMLVTLATDGEDGPTDAAGAVVTGGSWRRADTLGLQPVEYLNRSDSYPFFEALGDLLKPGATGTNVNDLVFLFSF